MWGCACGRPRPVEQAFSPAHAPRPFVQCACAGCPDALERVVGTVLGALERCAACCCCLLVGARTGDGRADWAAALVWALGGAASRMWKGGNMRDGRVFFIAFLCRLVARKKHRNSVRFAAYYKVVHAGAPVFPRQGRAV